MKKTISLFFVSVLHFHGFSQCHANAGKDTMVYEGSVVTLGTAPLPTDKNLTYKWSPANVGLSCTDCPTPVMTARGNVQLTLIVTDTATHCIASDLIMIIITSSSRKGSDDPTFDSPQPPEVSISVKSTEEFESRYDEEPHFPGGNTAFRNFLGSNLQYPQTAVDAGRQGKCWVGFVVDEEGNMADFTVIKKIPGCPECDAEALRVLKLMPKWLPGKLNGKPVKSRFQIPITFKLDQPTPPIKQ